MPENFSISKAGNDGGNARYRLDNAGNVLAWRRSIVTPRSSLRRDENAAAGRDDAKNSAIAGRSASCGRYSNPLHPFGQPRWHKGSRASSRQGRAKNGRTSGVLWTGLSGRPGPIPALEERYQTGDFARSVDTDNAITVTPSVTRHTHFALPAVTTLIHSLVRSAPSKGRLSSPWAVGGAR